MISELHMHPLLLTYALTLLATTNTSLLALFLALTAFFVAFFFLAIVLIVLRDLNEKGEQNHLDYTHNPA